MADEPRNDVGVFCIQCGTELEQYEHDYCSDCSRDWERYDDEYFRSCCDDDDWLYDDEPE